MDACDSPTEAPPHLEGLRSPAECRKPEGDPRYLAPELLQGKTATIGPTTDVYHLGGLLYRILTGRPPHTGKDASEQAASLPPRARSPGHVSSARRSQPRVGADCDEGAPPVAGKAIRSCHGLQAGNLDYRQHAGSPAISARAWTKLRSLAGDEAGQDGYGDLDEVISGFQQALALWPENAECA